MTGSVCVMTEAVIKPFELAAGAVRTFVDSGLVRTEVVKGEVEVNAGTVCLAVIVTGLISGAVVPNPVDRTAFCMLVVWITEGCAKRELIPTVTTGLVDPMRPGVVVLYPNLRCWALVMRGRSW